MERCKFVKYSGAYDKHELSMHSPYSKEKFEFFERCSSKSKTHSKIDKNFIVYYLSRIDGCLYNNDIDKGKQFLNDLYNHVRYGMLVKDKKYIEFNLSSSSDKQK